MIYLKVQKFEEGTLKSSYLSSVIFAPVCKLERGIRDVCRLSTPQKLFDKDFRCSTRQMSPKSAESSCPPNS